MKVKLTNVRNCFPKYYEAKPVRGSADPYYGGAYPVEPGSENHKKLEAAILAVAKQEWGDKAPAVLKKLREDGDISYRHKALSNDAGEVYGGFEGMYSLNASSNANKKPVPTLWDNDKQPLNASAVKVAEAAVKEGKLPAEKAVLRKGGEARLYSGCYVDVVVDIWPHSKNGNRINAQLIGVQFRGDGDAFSGGAVSSTDDFEDLAVGGDDSADDLLGAE